MGSEYVRDQLAKNLNFLYGHGVLVLTPAISSPTRPKPDYQAIAIKPHRFTSTYTKYLHSKVAPDRSHVVLDLLERSESEITKRLEESGVGFPFEGEENTVLRGLDLDMNERESDAGSNASAGFEFIATPRSSLSLSEKVEEGERERGIVDAVAYEPETQEPAQAVEEGEAEREGDVVEVVFCQPKALAPVEAREEGHIFEVVAYEPKVPELVQVVEEEELESSSKKNKKMKKEGNKESERLSRITKGEKVKKCRRVEVEPIPELEPFPEHEPILQSVSIEEEELDKPPKNNKKGKAAKRKGKSNKTEVEYAPSTPIDFEPPAPIEGPSLVAPEPEIENIPEESPEVPQAEECYPEPIYKQYEVLEPLSECCPDEVIEADVPCEPEASEPYPAEEAIEDPYYAEEPVPEPETESCYVEEPEAESAPVPASEAEYAIEPEEEACSASDDVWARWGLSKKDKKSGVIFKEPEPAPEVVEPSCETFEEYVDPWARWGITKRHRRTGSRVIVKEPAVEEPVAEEPAIEEPAVEEPAVEEPAVEEPAVEEPAVEEPTVEEPAAEEPVIEEPAAEEPAIEEPAAEEYIFEEPAAEEPAIEEPVIEEPAAEEPAVEEPAAEEPAAEEYVFEEPAAEEPVIEEPPAEECLPVITECPAVEQYQAVEDLLAAEPILDENEFTWNFSIIKGSKKQKSVIEEEVPAVEECSAFEQAPEEDPGWGLLSTKNGKKKNTIVEEEAILPSNPSQQSASHAVVLKIHYTTQAGKQTFGIMINLAENTRRGIFNAVNSFLDSKISLTAQQARRFQITHGFGRNRDLLELAGLNKDMWPAYLEYFRKCTEIPELVIEVLDK